MGLLGDAFMYLLAALIMVPLAKRIGLGSVLGYLIAGIAIGPVLGFVGAESEEIKHFAELGVVMMLFIIGLELQPRKLWTMRNKLLGLGGLQVGVTTIVFTAIGMGFDLPWQHALAIGMILALSSTAVVLQTLKEKGWMKTPPGQSAFSVLLFQDIAVIPMLALLPLLAIAGPDIVTSGADKAVHHGVIDDLPGWLQTLVIVGVIGGIIIAGRYLMHHAFRFFAEARLPEIFTGAALMLIIGIALLMNLVGLSPALGTFLAGVLLSDSEYRHELESNIEPFKGLLLGLFFISVGAGMDFVLLFNEPVTMIGLGIGLMGLKLLILLVLGRVFGQKRGDLWLFALSLSQAGEFGFVLFNFARSSHVLPSPIVDSLTLVVAISMLLTPLLFLLYDRVIAPRSIADAAPRDSDPIEEQGTVVVAGDGRFGHVVSRMLVNYGFKVIVFDHDPSLVERIRRVGIKTYYGDATRPDILHAAGAENAKLFVAALGAREKQTTVVEHVARNYPGCTIIARADDRSHVFELRKAGAHFVEREVFESALKAGKQALISLGTHPFRAQQLARAFRKHEEETMDQLEVHWQQDAGFGESYISVLRDRTEELATVMQMDRAAQHDTTESSWTPPPKDDDREAQP